MYRKGSSSAGGALGVRGGLLKTLNLFYVQNVCTKWMYNVIMFIGR